MLLTSRCINEASCKRIIENHLRQFFSFTWAIQALLVRAYLVSNTTHYCFKVNNKCWPSFQNLSHTSKWSSFHQLNRISSYTCDHMASFFLLYIAGTWSHQTWLKQLFSRWVDNMELRIENCAILFKFQIFKFQDARSKRSIWLFFHFMPVPDRFGTHCAEQWRKSVSDQLCIRHARLPQPSPGSSSLPGDHPCTWHQV